MAPVTNTPNPFISVKQPKKQGLTKGQKIALGLGAGLCVAILVGGITTACLTSNDLVRTVAASSCYLSFATPAATLMYFMQVNAMEEQRRIKKTKRERELKELTGKKL